MSTAQNTGAKPHRVSIGSEIDGYWLAGDSLTINGKLLSDDPSYKTLSVGLPVTNLADRFGSAMIPMKGRSTLELIPLGAGVNGDVARIHIFVWKPIIGKTGRGRATEGSGRSNPADNTNQGKSTYETASWLWVRRWVGDLRFRIGARVGLAGVTDGLVYDGSAIAWENIRFAKEIIDMGSYFYANPGLRISQPTDNGDAIENDIAACHFDVFGAHSVELVMSRNDNAPSGFSVPSGGSSHPSHTPAPDEIGCLYARM